MTGSAYLGAGPEAVVAVGRLDTPTTRAVQEYAVYARLGVADVAIRHSALVGCQLVAQARHRSVMQGVRIVVRRNS